MGKDSRSIISLSADPWTHIIALASSILLTLSPNSIVRVDYDPASILRFATEAAASIGLDQVYDDALYESLDLCDFSEDDYAENDRLLADLGLDAILKTRIAPLLAEEGRMREVKDLLHGISNKQKVLDMLTHGQRSFMKPTFRPNGGCEAAIGASYLEKRLLCNDAIVRLVREGKMIAFSEDALIASKARELIHVNTFVWAPKDNKIKGRTCMNASKKTKKFPSVNESVDLDRHDEFYPQIKLPLLPDIAEMACLKRDSNPGVRLAGGIIDVKGAYNQGAQSVTTSKLFGGKVKYENGMGKFVNLIVLYLVGLFGFTRGGEVYCTFASAIDEKHNQDQPVRRTHTYIDDGILIDTVSLIASSISMYVAIIITMFGPDGINDEKIKRWDGGLEAIGWSFNFDEWRVIPMQRGINKMLAYLFLKVPPGSHVVSSIELEKLVGLLSWYAAAIPAGRSFLGSLFACKSRLGKVHHRITLTELAMHDLDWWRSLAIIAHAHPLALGANIDHIRRHRTPTIFMRTDASTLVGGGGYLSITRLGKPLDISGQGAIRWTCGEMQVFLSMGISINVLEFFAVIYFCMVWSTHLSGQVVNLECDNTAAVAWLLRQRSKGHEAADALSKIFTLFCVAHSIQLLPSHLRGTENTIADFRSRDLSLLPQDADENMWLGDPSSPMIRERRCRRLLYLCVTRPETLRGQGLLEALTELRGDLGSPSAK